MVIVPGLDREALDRARVSRDPRFDGKFFIAVTSTGIYCRPICPVRSPKAQHIRYYATAAAAAEAGFRPCLRCRPEAAPGTPAWLGTSAVVHRALRLIEDGVLDEGSVEDLAARVGIGSRHLHRLFVQHVGAPPIVVAQTRRLHFAKRLLDDTDLAITEIALAAGFGSLRRFNAAFQQAYRRAPRELRRHRRAGAATERAGEVVLRLAFRPPYDWTSMHADLAARAVPGVERVNARGYARTAAWSGGWAIVCVGTIDGEDALELRVRNAPAAALWHLSASARRMFDVAADPARIAEAFAADVWLAPLVRRRPGLRIPGAWDPFECAVRALLEHGDGLAIGPARIARLVGRVGQPLSCGVEGLTHLFPTPAALASADLGSLGLGSDGIDALRALARAVIDGRLDFGAPVGQVVEQVVALLAALPGSSAAVAEEVALRALGDPDAFPVGDALLRGAAVAAAAAAAAAAGKRSETMEMAAAAAAAAAGVASPAAETAAVASAATATVAGGEPPTVHEIEARAESWRPWRGYAVCHLRLVGEEAATATATADAAPTGDRVRKQRALIAGHA